jgi:hypothetical protein
MYKADGGQRGEFFIKYTWIKDGRSGSNMCTMCTVFLCAPDISPFTLALSQGLHYTLWCVVALLLVVVIRCGPCGARLFSEGRQSERNGRLDYHETTEEADVRPAIGLPWCCDVVRSYRARLLVCTTTRRKIGRVSTVPEKC